MLDDDNFVAMASLDLSCAFDVVNVPLLIKRLTIIGLPEDVVGLVEVWLTERCLTTLKIRYWRSNNH